MKLLPLSDNVNYAVVDDEDFDRLCQFQWRLWGSSQTTIVRCKSQDGKLILTPLANEIMHRNDCMFDHADTDFKNNQKSNLRPCTHSQNMMNRNKFVSDNISSKYKGVSYRKDRNRWRARITQNKLVIILGDFLTEEEAAKYYDAAAQELFGEFARLNFPEKQKINN